MTTISSDMFKILFGGLFIGKVRSELSCVWDKVFGVISKIELSLFIVVKIYSATETIIYNCNFLRTDIMFRSVSLNSCMNATIAVPL